MNTNPQHQQETEWHGELQQFASPALAPDDPNLEPRECKGRPVNLRNLPPQNDAGTESKEA